MQDHGLSISDILLLHSQNQFLQTELQVVVVVLMVVATMMIVIMHL